jgi:hypothetical protein
MQLTKRIAYRNKAILKAAKGEKCTICGDECGTIVFCHLNESWAGKGLGQKVDDCAGFFGCSFCHDVYDGRRKRLGEPMADYEILRAYYRTIRRLLDSGVLK